MKYFEANFGKWIITYRWWVIVIMLALVFIAASGAKHLSLTTNYRIFFSEDNPQLLAFEALEDIYNKNDNVMFVLSPKDGQVFTRQTLTAIEDLTKRAWQLPFSLRVDSISNFQYTHAKGDELIVRDLVEDAQHYTDADLIHIKNIAVNEPLLRQNLIAPQADVTAVNVTIQLPGENEITETPAVVKVAREMADYIRQTYPDIEVRLSGMVFMNNAFSEASKVDMTTLIPLSFLIMIIFLAFMIRDYHGGWAKFVLIFGCLVGGITLTALAMIPLMVSIGIFVVWFIALLFFFPGTISTLLVIILSIVTALGIFGHLGFQMSPPTTTTPIIILTVAIANCVHILVTLLYEMRHGNTKHGAIVESLRLNLQPVFLASITTAIGFLTMNFSDVPPFRHLGNIVAMGVLASFVLSVTFLPALLSLLPMNVTASKDSNSTVMARFGDFVVNKRRPIFWGMIVFIVSTIAFLPRNDLNDVFVNYFDESIQFRADTDYITKRLTGIYRADYSIDSGVEFGISDPQFQKQLAAFAQWYRQQPVTMHVNVITDIMTRLNKNLHGDDPDWYRLPDNKELAAQYLFLYELSLPLGLDLNNQININKSATRMTVNFQTISSNDVITLVDNAKRWLKENAPAIKAADPSGPTVMFANIGSRNIKSMLLGTTLALILISFILIFALRSFKIGLVSMIPNLVPAAMGFGVWGLFVGEVGLALSVVTSMTLGIVVDDTVHFLSKYNRARREKGYASQAAVRYAFKTVGTALITTSIVLVAGFIVLSFSKFELNSGMGMLTSIVIVFALIADLLFLPTLLMKLEDK